MKRNLLRVLFAVVFVAAVSAAAHAQTCGVEARGDFQVLQSAPTGSVVRAWVTNTCFTNLYAKVTVVGFTPTGGFVSGFYPVFVPKRSYAFVDVKLPGQIAGVAFVIVTKS
jgi:hypothetical protein